MLRVQKWEAVDEEYKTFRLRVHGGWLIKLEIFNQVSTVSGRDNDQISYDSNQQTSLTFVPDAEHEWGKKDQLKNLLTEDV